MLWFVCHHVPNQITRELDIEKLRELKRRTFSLEALLRLDKDACQDCIDFCQLIGHKLPRNGYNHGVDDQFKACYTKKKLMLWFVCHHVPNQITRELDIEKLRELNRRAAPLEALLRLDKDACQGYNNFRNKLKPFTGIVFQIQVDMTVIQTEQYRDGT